MKKISIIVLALFVFTACAKKTANTSGPANAPKGTVTETNPAAESTGKKDMTGTWIVNEGGRTWELVITPSGANTWTTTPTLLENPDKNDMIYGKPGDKGDTIIIVSDEPGKFRVRWAKAENFHKADFWEGTGTYDDNSFNFAGYYVGKRKS